MQESDLVFVTVFVAGSGGDTGIGPGVCGREAASGGGSVCWRRRRPVRGRQGAMHHLAGHRMVPTAHQSGNNRNIPGFAVCTYNYTKKQT